MHMHLLAEFLATKLGLVLPTCRSAVEHLSHDWECDRHCPGLRRQQDLRAGFTLDPRGGGEVSLQHRNIEHIRRGANMRRKCRRVIRRTRWNAKPYRHGVKSPSR